jgi:glutaredoxin
VNRRQTAARGLLTVLALLALPAGASADRIVLRDGQTIETRGAVKLDSRRAVYTDLAGHLVALRIEEVDVARTTAKPAPAVAGTAALPGATTPGSSTPAKSRAPVLRLTDADVRHVADEGSATAVGEEAPVVTLYSTAWCGWCRKSRELMQSLGIAFVERDVERDAQAAADKARLAPGSGVPVLVRGSEIQAGFNEATIRSWAPAKSPGTS